MRKKESLLLSVSDFAVVVVCGRSRVEEKLSKNSALKKSFKNQKKKIGTAERQSSSKIGRRKTLFFNFTF